MNKDDVIKALEQLKKQPKRKFSQSYDLIINLKELNLKKPEENVDLSLVLPNDIEKKVKICALVDKSLADQAKVFDKVIQKDQLDSGSVPVAIFTDLIVESEMQIALQDLENYPVILKFPSQKLLIYPLIQIQFFLLYHH